MDRAIQQQIAAAQERRAQAAGVDEHVVNGRPVRGVRLTMENLFDVSEWADGKCFFDPAEPGEQHPLLRPCGTMKITGYSVFTPGGKIKAEFGDLIYEEYGKFYIHRGQPAGTAAVSR